ncbi:MAG: membrane protein insertase YidC, partial [Arenimonas sp.]
MNQTRTFLLIAWLAVAFLLFQQWQTPAPTPPTPAANTPAAPAPAAVGALPALPDAPVAGAPALPALPSAASAPQTVEIVTDVYRLTVDLKGVSIIRAELLTYPIEKKAGSANVMLLDNGSTDFFVAESGWLTRTHTSEPNHNA